MSSNLNLFQQEHFLPSCPRLHAGSDNKPYMRPNISDRKSRSPSRSPLRDKYRGYHRYHQDEKEKLREYQKDQRDYSRYEKPQFSTNRKNDFAGANLKKIDWASTELTTFKKNFYTEHPNIKARSPEEIQSYRKENNITIKSEWAPSPTISFEEAQFPSYINSAIERIGYKNPTPIQAQGWPAALSGSDVIGIAQTGSGKTLTFLLPGIVHINAQAPIR
jgi:ATP-dependent RNA helicase DDX5/DBP2